jgi:copper transport protein
VWRRLAIGFALSTILIATLSGHAGLRSSNPLDGVTLGDTPSLVQLTFTEQPEPRLSQIHVRDASGASYDVGRPTAVPDDPLSISVALRRLPDGVYTVNWRTVSSIDGHAAAGAYAFGVRAPVAGSAFTTQSSSISLLELGARWVFVCGLVLLLGAAGAELGRFGGTRTRPVAAMGWALSAAGLALLAVAQQRSGGTSLAALMTTRIGRALQWRAWAIGGAGAALALASWAVRAAGTRIYTAAMAAAGLAALAAMAVHVGAGHAAADPQQPLLEALLQWSHFAVSGIWIGGLAALLLATRGAASEIKAAAARRFSRVAAIAILAVFITGVLRALAELATWGDLTKTGYGRALLVKVVLLAAMAALGAFNRWRGVPRAGIDLGPLRKAGSGELVLAAAALLAAAVLGTLAPPAAARLLPGLSASGADFGTTVRVTLSAASDQPGPNRFVARIEDYDSGKPVRAEHVALRFASLDDPDLPSTSLSLTPAVDGSYVGSGANLSLDGRWRATVAVQRNASSVEVPLEVLVRGRAQEVETRRIPGAPVHTVEVRGAGLLRFEVDPERAGLNRLYVTSLDFIFDLRPVSQMVVTLASGDDAPRQLTLERLNSARYAANIELAAGRNTVAAVARTPDGTRLRAVVHLDVPAR